MQRRLAPAANPKMIDWIVAGVFSSIIVSMAVMVIDYQGVWSVWLLLVLALTMLLAQRHSERLRSSMMPVFLLSILLVISYSGFKWLFGAIIPATSAMHVEALSAVDIVAILLFVSLFVLNWMLRYQPHRPSIHHLHIALFAGLYLDEWLTRLTLQVWPVQLPAPSNNKVLDKATEVEEV